MQTKMKAFLGEELKKLEDQKLFKHERIIESAQGAEIVVKGKSASTSAPTIILDFLHIPI